VLHDELVHVSCYCVEELLLGHRGVGALGEQGVLVGIGYVTDMPDADPQGRPDLDSHGQVLTQLRREK